MDYDINDTAPEHKSGISSAARGGTTPSWRCSRSSKRRTTSGSPPSATALMCCWTRRSTASSRRTRRADEADRRSRAEICAPVLEGTRRDNSRSRFADGVARASTRARSRLMCARARAGRCARSKPRRCPPAQCRWRVSGAGRTRARDRPAAYGDLADPQHLVGARNFRQRLQEAVHDRGSCHRLGRAGCAHADHVADARCTQLSGHGALRHASGDRDAAR